MNVDGNSKSPPAGSIHYVLKTGKPGASRLRLLHDVYGRSTEVLLTEVGLNRGMRAVDMGCGIGIVSTWMAEQVGRDGSVVGVDISKAQLDLAQHERNRRDLPQLHFRHADVYDCGLPRAAFDLVYCRFLLCHLAEPQRALAAMAALLKPHGVLVCDALDMASLFVDPPSPAYQRMLELTLSLARERRVNYCIGPRLHRFFREVGFESPRVRIDQPVYIAGKRKRFWEFSFLETAPAIVDAGLCSAEEVDRLAQEMEAVATDDTSIVAQARMVQVWQQKIGAPWN